jgi:hypothetical protein
MSPSRPTASAHCAEAFGRRLRTLAHPGLPSHGGRSQLQDYASSSAADSAHGVPGRMWRVAVIAACGVRKLGRACKTQQSDVWALRALGRPATSDRLGIAAYR